MKSVSAALLLAGVATAYEGYGPASSSTPSPTSSPAPYTTINPCPGCPASIAPKPCTVTEQYQTVSSCSVYGPKGTPVCSTYPYVSTTVKDYEGKVKTITKYDEYVTIDYTKSTKTIYPKPTAGYGHYKNSTKPTYELYEKIVKVKYYEIGPLALPGTNDYLYKEYYNKEKDETYQPVEVIEYDGSKYVTHTYTYTHGKPTASATTYEKPGIYTIPEYTVTVTASTDECVPTTYHATKGDNVYGAVTTAVPYPTKFVYPYPEVKEEGGKVYSTVIYTTIIYNFPGTYTIVPPTHTYCDADKDITYPTVKPVYPGEYTHTKETVTITKSHQPYTCSYDQSSTYSTPSSTATGPTYPNPSDVNSSPVQDYGYATAAAYVKRGGVIQRKRDEVKRSGEKKRVILV